MPTRSMPQPGSCQMCAYGADLIVTGEHIETAFSSQFGAPLGDEGARALDEFVRAGGTLVCLNQGASYAIGALHLPVRNVVDTLSRKNYFSSGSILEVATDPSTGVLTLTAGGPRNSPVSSVNSNANYSRHERRILRSLVTIGGGTWA